MVLLTMITSKPVRGEEAHNLGLVDSVILGDELVDTARRWALDILERRKPWVSSLYSLLHIFFAQCGTTKAESSSDGSLELPIWLSSTVHPDTWFWLHMWSDCNITATFA
ncbi:3-hydroxyacyl-CoA dehydrogenase, conserved site-containing protein [Tanacetum coccineum]